MIISNVIYNFMQTGVMHQKQRLVTSLCISLFMGTFFILNVSLASASQPLPVPRFVTIKSDEANARTGPSVRSPIRWVYTKEGFPIEITAEFKNWRRVEDINGDIGWMHQSLLSGRRNGIVKGKNPMKMYKNHTTDSRVVAHIEPKTIVRLNECDQKWCEVSASGYTGWMQKKFLWGVYADEVMD